MVDEILFEEEGWVGYNKAFRRLVEAETVRGDTIIFSGNPGSCFPFASRFFYEIRDLDLDMFWAPSAELEEARKLEWVEGVGFQVGEKRKPPKAKLIVLTPGLQKVEAWKIESFLENALKKGGKVVGETPITGAFERIGWKGKINLDYILELSPSSAKVFKLRAS